MHDLFYQSTAEEVLWHWKKEGINLPSLHPVQLQSPQTLIKPQWVQQLSALPWFTLFKTASPACHFLSVEIWANFEISIVTRRSRSDVILSCDKRQSEKSEWLLVSFCQYLISFLSFLSAYLSILSLLTQWKHLQSKWTNHPQIGESNVAIVLWESLQNHKVEIIPLNGVNFTRIFPVDCGVLPTLHILVQSYSKRGCKKILILAFLWFSVLTLPGCKAKDSSLIRPPPSTETSSVLVSAYNSTFEGWPFSLLSKKKWRVVFTL